MIILRETSVERQKRRKANLKASKMTRMRIVIVCLLMARACLGLTVTLLEERSLNEIPRIAIEFPDGYKDMLVLDKFHANDQDRIANEDHCNYIGHLENESEACVAMTGCLGSEDVHFTVLSAHASESSRFIWTKEGSVEILEFEVPRYI